MPKTILAWHFLRSDKKLANDDNRLVTPGETLTVTGELELCAHGLHGSINPRDALRYAPGTIVQRVEHSGDTQTGTDKLCSSERKCLWLADASHALRVFAVWCRRRQVEHRLGDREPSLAVIWALDAAERYLNSTCERDELEAARSAADAAYADADADAVADATYAAAYAAYAATDATAAADDAADADADADAAEKIEQSEKLTELLMALKPE